MIVHGGSYMTEATLRDLGMKRVGENVRVHALSSLVGLENILLMHYESICDVEQPTVLHLCGEAGQPARGLAHRLPFGH